MNTTTLNMTTLDGNVIIKKGGGGTPTPPSGGENGDWEYYDCNIEEFQNLPLYLYPAALIKTARVTDGVLSLIRIGCYTFSYASADEDKYIAIAIDYSQPCIDVNGERTLREYIALYPNGQLAQLITPLQSLPRLTKEQFYLLD